ncbi:MAG: hypothetical protein J6334_09030 [Kiritimatiellae bacterium]|nr:hypothetical protein [Kiritimatiellia bacterium]
MRTPRPIRLAALLTGALCLLRATAGSLDLDARPNGLGGFNVSNSAEATIIAPDPVVPSDTFQMATLPIVYRPPTISFNVGTDRRVGPFPLIEGTPLGTATNAHRLVQVGNGSFSIQAPDGTVKGPFSDRHGTPVAIGTAPTTVFRVKPDFTVTLASDGFRRQKPKIGLTPVNETLATSLGELRTYFVTLINRRNLDTAPMHLSGVPRVHYRNTGVSSASTTINVSRRDQENARWQAERGAVNALERLFEKRFRYHSYAITDRFTYHFQMPPGDYILCAMQKVQDTRSTAFAGSTTLIWWSRMTFDGQHGCSITLTPENAISWQGVFCLPE